MTPQQQEEVDLAAIAVDVARRELEANNARLTILAADLRREKAETARLDDVLKRAEIALSKAKKRGKGGKAGLS